MMAEMMLAAFKDPVRANEAVEELQKRGYTPENISTISTRQTYNERGEDTATSVGQGAGTGAMTGGLLGGLAGLLAAGGVVPAIAGLFVGGPLVAALGMTGAAALTATGALTGAAAGSLVGALTGLGLSKQAATSYDETVRHGGVIIGLSGRDDLTAEARSVLERCGAEDISVVTMETKTQTRPATRMEPAFGERRETPESER
jgi:hypothetical protein